MVPDSVNQLYRHIQAEQKFIKIVASRHHGIVYDDVDDTQQKVIDTVLAVDGNLTLGAEDPQPKMITSG